MCQHEGMLYLLATALLLAAMPAPATNPRVEFKVAGKGAFVVELFESEAPKTVEHVLALVKKGYFDGILFHRVVPDFVAQAGDPKSKEWSTERAKGAGDGQGGTEGLGAGGSGKTIPFEENDHKHDAGTMGMALSAPRSATGDSQFFINLKDNHRLNGQYCVFGKVVEGFDIVMKVERGDKIESAKVVVKE